MRCKKDVALMPQRIEGILDTGFLRMVYCIVLWYTLYHYTSMPARGSCWPILN